MTLPLSRAAPHRANANVGPLYRENEGRGAGPTYGPQRNRRAMSGPRRLLRGVRPACRLLNSEFSCSIVSTFVGREYDNSSGSRDVWSKKVIEVVLVLHDVPWTNTMKSGDEVGNDAGIVDLRTYITVTSGRLVRETCLVDGWMHDAGGTPILERGFNHCD